DRVAGTASGREAARPDVVRSKTRSRNARSASSIGQSRMRNGVGYPSVMRHSPPSGNSAHIDWMSEYDTNITAQNGQQWTNQHIGRGGFITKIQISVSGANGGTNIANTNVRNELNAQITAGH